MCCISLNVRASRDKDIPLLGVQFKHTGYMTAASFHFVNTIRSNPIPQSDTFRQQQAYLNHNYLTCDLAFDSFVNYLTQRCENVSATEPCIGDNCCEERSKILTSKCDRLEKNGRYYSHPID